jgi:hypothetical protein
MFLFKVTLSCFFLFLVVDRTSCLENRKKLVTPPQQFRKPNMKIGTNAANKKRKEQFSRVDNNSLEDKWASGNRKIVLREITRKPPIATTKGLTSYVGKLSKGSMFVAGNAYKLTKSTMKASFDLLAGKHVSLFEIAGTWTVMQAVVLPDGTTHTTPVIFQLAENKTLVTVFNGVKCRTKYTFQERAWPR